MANLIGVCRIQLVDCFQKEIQVDNFIDNEIVQVTELNVEFEEEGFKSKNFESCKQLITKLISNTHLKKISLTLKKQNNIQSLWKDIQLKINELINLEFLYVDLKQFFFFEYYLIFYRHNNLGDSCFLPYFIKANKQIQHLELLFGNNHISDKFVTNLVDNLSNKTQLKELLLDFSYNIIKKESIFLITQCISNNLINLSKLALYLTGNNGFKNNEINLDLGFLSRINSFYVDLAAVRLSDENFIKLISCLKYAICINDLYLVFNNNNISQKGFSFLKQIIKQNTQNLSNFEINLRSNQYEAEIEEINELIQILLDKPYIQTIQVNDQSFQELLNAFDLEIQSNILFNVVLQKFKIPFQ
ncbi:hypothetical protein TTHERM_000940244 (macronuclear) [Tetrahymena thermophila SB210]|uniref:Kinase domain protein n=1 Tax=Tetrahymena thermophila (strain SB210) TaxID=312017 RepID=W7XEB1_TETTS|nr:hypothetical protein TTHERM_000940244 [Tetrahymena thermophila SB210]EWS71219.1 hypothetical protein TTHERM_000940244 [Tetrahymena thermophila SB210]|eukprot:XP_012656240.1 hypothetical protein TTHERM_000940244 [Tetrahymena thermophila SB210]